MLPVSGTLGLNQVRTEIRTITDPISLGDFDVRELATKPSGVISFGDLRGKELKEHRLLRFKRTGDRGGSFSADTYFFRGSGAVSMTAMQLIEASKYEQTIRIESAGYNIAFADYVKHPITTRFKANNVKIIVPGSADYWTGDFFGKVYNRHAENRNFELTTHFWSDLVKTSAF